MLLRGSKWSSFRKCHHSQCVRVHRSGCERIRRVCHARAVRLGMRRCVCVHTRDVCRELEYHAWQYSSSTRKRISAAEHQRVLGTILCGGYRCCLNCETLRSVKRRSALAAGSRWVWKRLEHRRRLRRRPPRVGWHLQPFPVVPWGPASRGQRLTRHGAGRKGCLKLGLN